MDIENISNNSNYDEDVDFKTEANISLLRKRNLEANKSEIKGSKRKVTNLISRYRPIIR